MYIYTFFSGYFWYIRIYKLLHIFSLNWVVRCLPTLQEGPGGGRDMAVVRSCIYDDPASYKLDGIIWGKKILICPT